VSHLDNTIRECGGSVGETRDLNHPVWDVYDLYRKARLNVKYYCARLHRLNRQNFWIEFFIAATASTSAIASLTIWNTREGIVAWKVLGGVAAILAVAKPLLKLPDRISRLEEVITGYRTLEHDMKRIEVSVRQRKSYDAALQERLGMALERMAPLETRTVESSESKKVLRRCALEVDSELPAENFFIPGA
jgi:hypothetical protein